MPIAQMCDGIGGDRTRRYEGLVSFTNAPGINPGLGGSVSVCAQ